MEQRIIKLSVKNEYILGEGVVIGAAGSHDEVLLELDFRASPVWHGTTKKAVFYDALGTNPTTILLTTDKLVSGETEVYRISVPAEAKGQAGKCFLTIEGVVTNGETESVRVVTEAAQFDVLQSRRYEQTSDPKPVTPTQAEQLQAEIDDIKSTVSEAKDSADAAEASKKAASASEQAAAKSEEKAAASEANAKASEEAAQKSAAAAAKIEETAKAAEAARQSNEAQRQTNEQLRQMAENSRAFAETQRVNAEDTRKANEVARQNAEAQRVSAENARNVWEDYDVTKFYTVGNKVVYGGSSYLCIKPCTGVNPTNGTYWRRIAGRGNDGKSAYASAQDGGYTGTEAQFNASLGALINIESVDALPESPDANTLYLIREV